MGAARWRRRTETITNDARHFLRRYEKVLSKQHGGFRKFISQLRDVLFAALVRDVQFLVRTLTQEEIATILNGLSADGQVARASSLSMARPISATRKAIKASASGHLTGRILSCSTSPLAAGAVSKA